MRKNRIILLVIGVMVVAVSGGIAYLRQYIPEYRWNASYILKSKEPYGTRLTYEILEESGVFEELKVLETPLSESLKTTRERALYLFIGEYAYYDSLSVDQIKNFVSKGNDAFVAIENFHPALGDIFLIANDSTFSFDYYKDSIMTTSFVDSSVTETFTFHFQFLKTKADYYWTCLNKGSFSDDLNPGVKMISTIDSTRINCWKIQYGEGNIYIHTNPLLFTNYHAITDNGYNYLNSLLKILESYSTCHWDEYSKVWNFESIGRRGFGDNPLNFLLSQRSLRWAYYLSLFFILVYLLFRVKRVQRPIPVLRKNRNTSVEYAKSVGTLHYHKSDHIALSKKMADLFFSFVRQRYNISVHPEKDLLITMIAGKSEVPEKYIRKIYKLYLEIKENPDTEKRNALALHSHLEYFYKNCK